MVSLPQNCQEAAKICAKAKLPAELLRVAQTLHHAGFEVVVVGGAVRDFLLGREHGDWDLATSAMPEEVIRLFPHTIPTGLEHGTVTVVQGKGTKRIVTEVTTFRGEGIYKDGRRPSEVRFLRSLEDDLARRDFTINAFAWNPLTQVFTDCFHGLQDLREGIIRAVGDPHERFQEDGLRAMRAVRFCASLSYRLEPTTEKAVGSALHVLAKVSRERVRVELIKMLESPKPSLGLKPMVFTGMWPYVLAPLPESSDYEEAIAAVDEMRSDAILRLARLLWPLRHEREVVERVANELKLSRHEQTRLLALCHPTVAKLLEVSSPVSIRRCVSMLGRLHFEDAMELLALPPNERDKLREACAGAALAVDELAIGGKGLILQNIAQPGPALGMLLRELLAWVMEDPSRNQVETLLAHARKLKNDLK